MLKKLTTVPILAFIVLIEPLQAMAQQSAPAPAPQDYYGPGPWRMWEYGYGWHFWGMFPMMILFLLLFVGVIFLLASRFGGHGPHHWGPGSPTNPPWSDPNIFGAANSE